MLKKILLGLVALFLIFVGLIILSIGYVKNNPQIVFDTFNRGISKIFDGKPYQEEREETLQEVQILHLKSLSSNIVVEIKDSPTAKILYQGRIAGFEQGPLISAPKNREELEINFHEPMHVNHFLFVVNGQNMAQEQNGSFEAHVIIPESFKGLIQIETKTGQVQMTVPSSHLYEFDLKSVEGQIENKAVQLAPAGATASEVGKIQITTGSGNIQVRN